MTEWLERNGFIPIPTQSLTDDEIQVVKSILGEPWEEKKMADICTDNRFELIEKYKKALIDSTNIESAQDEMAVLDNLLFRFWQMGWLDRLEQPEQRWIPCSERLPEDYEDVLVWFEYFRYGNYNCLYQMYGIGSYSSGYYSWLINQETGWNELKVFAWMPLPKPPKEEDE